MFDPLTGQNKELPEEEVIQSPVAQAMSDQPDPKEAFVKIGGTGDESRDNMIQAFMRGMQERSVLLNKDPSEVLDTMLDKVSPGKMMLTNMLHGAGAALLNQPFKTVRESLYERLVEQQKIKLQQQQNDSLRLQQFMQMQSREGIAEQNLKSKELIEAERIKVKKDLAAIQDKRAGERIDLGRQKLDATVDQWESSQSWKENVLDYTKERDKIKDGQFQETLRIRSEANEIRRLGAEGAYDAKMPQASAIQELGRRATSADRKRVIAAADDIAQEIDSVLLLPEGPEKEAALVNAYKDAAIMVNQRIVEGLPSAEAKNNRNFRFKSLHVADRALEILSTTDTNIVKNKLEQIARNVTGDHDPAFTELYQLLRDNFVDYRQNISGAAFSDQESKDYESLNALTGKPGNVNIAMLQNLQKNLVSSSVREINAVNPEALRYYIRNDDEGNKGIYLDGMFFYDGPGENWVGKLIKESGF